MMSGFGRGPIPGMTGGEGEGLTPGNAHLRLVTGEKAGAVFPLSALAITIGRNDPPAITVDIDLTEYELSEIPVVSRRHAEIQWQEGDLLIVDLGSTNGTFVNGNSLKGGPSMPSYPVQLKAGDRVVFANLEFEVVTA